MIKKKDKTLKFALKTVCILLLALVAAGSMYLCACASTSYISDITVASGAKGREHLENKGYSVLFQGMNMVTDSDSAVYIGYKTGSDAVTDLVVSTQRSDSVTYNGCNYKLVSNTSLNKGTDGKPLYLYYTKDSSAGGKITSLDTVSGFSDTDEVVSLRNDGSSPVRMSDGTVANLDKGVSNSQIYLLMYKNEGIKKYISDVCLVTGSSKANAINKAASRGCDYYIDKDIGGSSKIAYIAYQRTSDKSEAITNFTFNDSEVSFDRGGDSDALLIDITHGRFFEKSFKLGEWAGVYASYDRSVVGTSQYEKLSSSTQECSCVFAGSSKIYAVYEGKFASAIDDEEVTDEETEPSEDELAAEDAEGEAVDEFYDIDKTDEEQAAEEQTEEETAEPETLTESVSDAVASVINGGNIAIILCFAIIIALAVVGTSVYKRNKKRK